MTQRILLLAGKKGSGKDTLADLLKPQYSRASFADPLYEEVRIAFGLKDQTLLRNRDTKEVPTLAMSLYRCQDENFKKYAFPDGVNEHEPQSPRRILQLWGTDYRQNSDGKLYWVDKLTLFLQENSDIDFCIPDLRFPHEYSAIFEYCLEYDASLIVVRVERDVEDDSTSGHVSENALAGFEIFDFVVKNPEGRPQGMSEQFWSKV